MVSRFSAEIAAACMTAAFGTVIVVGALEFGIGWGTAGPQPGAFPFYIGLLIVAASIATVLQALASQPWEPAGCSLAAFRRHGSSPSSVRCSCS